MKEWAKEIHDLTFLSQKIRKATGRQVHFESLGFYKTKVGMHTALGDRGLCISIPVLTEVTILDKGLSLGNQLDHSFTVAAAPRQCSTEDGWVSCDNLKVSYITSECFCVINVVFNKISNVKD